MPKILSNSGRSLSDAYDVEGSIIGIEQLETREVSLVHEMGQTLFSERLSGFIRLMTTGVLLQNIDYDVILTDLPSGISRVLGVQVFADNAARVLRAALMLRTSQTGAADEREIPIWVWDATNSLGVDFDDGTGRSQRFVLTPVPTMSNTPTVLLGVGQPQRVGAIALRGRTTGFGAGNVTVSAVIYVGFSEVGGLSSRGLPVPGW